MPPSLDGSAPIPPPLPSLAAISDAGSTASASTAPTGPIETYEFLFRDDEEFGVSREKFTYDDAQRKRNEEIGRLLPKYQQANQPQQQPGQQGGYDPRAGAEWDFYYQQLELYSNYVQQRVLEGVEDLPEPSYDAQAYLQDRTDLKAGFDKAALELANKQRDENEAFYERLGTREDRRRKYYEWIAAQQRELDDWAKIWARKVNGSLWAAAEEPLNRDDWYHGTNFAGKQPVTVEVDGQSYLLSEEPQRSVAPEQLNVLSDRLTPYDIVDRNGDLKNPRVEIRRGTAVEPPVDATSGTLELGP
jgi:hypothetical protein